MYVRKTFTILAVATVFCQQQVSLLSQWHLKIESKPLWKPNTKKVSWSGYMDKEENFKLACRLV